MTTKPTPKASRKRKASETDILINVVLDRSGSMASIKEATIEGFNGFLAEQAKLPGARFSLTQFDTEGIDHLYINSPVEKVKPLNGETYVPRGGTPLYDAVGRSIAEVESASPAGKVVFVIITDGEENSSREFSRDDVFNRIAEKRKAGWEFVFMGANVDAYATGAAMGIAAASSYQYGADAAGVSGAFAAVSHSTTMYRSGAAPSMVMPPRSGRKKRLDKN
jgi:Mg-chelatase subunit ChlD